MRIKKNTNGRIVWQTVRRIAKGIFGVQGLRRGRFQLKQGFKLTELYSEERPYRVNNNSAQNNREM